jgi:hypothetical protein
VFGISLVALWVSTHFGAYYEKRWRPLKSGEQETFKVVLGATLSLLGLIVAFTFSMAVSRYDQRKDYEEEEANAIGTEFLRAELLPAAAADKTKRLLRSYLDQRILSYESRSLDELTRINERTVQLQREMWSAVQSVASVQPTPINALASMGMNDVLNRQGYTQAAWLNRIPLGAWALMFVIAISCCLLTGYGSHEARPALLVILPVVLSLAFFFIADIDSPRYGVIRVRPYNLIDLAQTLSAPPIGP